ncbi:amidase [Salinarimonas ramus]|uniref:Amidase n=1 Tax=Salinarimonas ramus TaxID=690164 RepID=A0A917QF88_9HYPH|nr:amidase [Salinarimonas ramus]GGK47602.1 amidase [Salinarimonas ramus]
MSARSTTSIRPIQRDDLGAFCAHAPLGSLAIGGGSGPLEGVSLAVKDLFDVVGVRTGAGSPAWLEAAEPAAESAAAVRALVAAGATVVGKTLTDELAWSLNGENVHYGTPVNPRAPGRVPGGSSAGSAAAVAGALVDLALGTDTGGSVRLPASYCGIWGFRPTHGRVPMAGAVPLAPSYDTVGWFARDLALLELAGSVLLAQPLAHSHGFRRLVVASDLFARVDEGLQPALRAATEAIAARFSRVDAIELAPDGIAQWRLAFRVAQSAEVWETHRAWVERAAPTFGPGIEERFVMASQLTPDEIAAARRSRAAIRERMDAVLGKDALLLVPSAASIAPRRAMDAIALEELRNRALEILCPAGHAGLPQVTMPAVDTPDGPIGLGLIGARGSDERLLACGRELAYATAPLTT